MAKGLAFLVVVTLSLAGCSGGESKTVSPSSSAVVAAPGENPDAGRLEGLVIDDQNAPVAGVVIGLKEVTVEATSDAAGSFVIGNLAPADYTLFAQKLGYEAASKRFTIAPQETLRETIILNPLPIAEGHVDVEHKAAQIDAAFGWSIAGDSGHGCIYPAVTCQSVASAANHPFTVKDPEETPLAGLVLEASWMPNSAVCAKTLRLRIFSPGTGTNPTDTNPGHWTNDPHPTWKITNPVVMRIPRAEDGTQDAIDGQHRKDLNDGEPLTVKGTWTARTFPPGRGLTNLPVDFNCFTQQKIDIWLSKFYLDEPALDYSARPEG